jgi:hypothetical protein
MDKLTTAVARRLSRRSLFAYAGRVSALAAGGGAASLLLTPVAAASGYCGYTHSVNCVDLAGWSQNGCPGESCNNTSVYWTDCDESLCRAPSHVRFYDCCNSCDSSGVCYNCHCNYTDGPSSCCYSGNGSWCSSSCSGGTVCCRRYQCSSGNPSC